MSGADVEVVRAVTSWAVGFLLLLIAGVGIPLLCSFTPDSIDYGRRTGAWKPLAVIAGLTAGLVVIAVYESTYTGAPASPSPVVWGSLTALLATATSSAAGGHTILRAVHRRSERREAMAAVMEPVARVPAQGARVPPAAVARMNARQAEHLACAWMHYLGADDAIVTPERRDGGVDVRSRHFLAQVKHLRGETVGVAAIRQLHGVAAAENRRAVFFSSTGYTPDAVAFARDTGIALFIVRAAEGRLVPHGTTAQHYALHGLTPTPHH